MIIWVFFKLIKTHIPPKSGKNEKILKCFEKNKTKSFGFGNKKLGSDTDNEIGPWFWFPISKPGFGRTLMKLAVLSVICT